MGAGVLRLLFKKFTLHITSYSLIHAIFTKSLSSVNTWLKNYMRK